MKEPYKRDHIWQKRAIILCRYFLHKSLLEVSYWKYLHILSISRLDSYGVDTVSSLLKNIGLFCKRDLWKRRYSAKETYIFNEPTNHSHPILEMCTVGVLLELYRYFFNLLEMCLYVSYWKYPDSYLKSRNVYCRCLIGNI